MEKKMRITLYILSVLAVLGLIVAAYAAAKRQGAEETFAPEAAGIESQTEDMTGDAAAGDGESEGQQAAAAGDAESEGQAAAAGDGEGKGHPDAVTGDGGGEDTDGETTILFTGDVLFANAFKAGYDAKGIEGVIEKDLLAELNDADILMVNNEFPYSDRGVPMEDKQFTFRCSPSYVKALNEMGVDVVSLANNHTLDYGKEALSDTFATLDQAGILYGGAGESVERAEEVQVIEVNGKKYGFLAVSRVIPVASWKVENSAPGIFSCYDDTRLVELVAEAKKECDFLAVYPHWGVEYAAYPESYQTKIAERCIEAGADVIVGSHTHCLQGVSYIDGKPVFYSLGNFIFGQNIDRSAILKVTVDDAGNVSCQFLPVYAAGGVTYLAEGEQAEQICRYLDSISDASVGADGSVTE
ncbi:MAG: CapA family protein [Roseburia sp.]|nr:CapA family protein [Roseburia sp.]